MNTKQVFLPEIEWGIRYKPERLRRCHPKRVTGEPKAQLLAVFFHDSLFQESFFLVG